MREQAYIKRVGGYEGISEVRQYIRGTRVYQRFGSVSEVRGYIRGSGVYQGFGGVSEVHVIREDGIQIMERTRRRRDG